MIRRVLGIILLVSFIGISFYKPVQEYISIPRQITLFEHDEETIAVASIPIQSTQHEDGIYALNETIEDGKRTLSVKGNESGEEKLLLQMGNFPIKKVNVQVLPDLKIVPGGQSIGVKLNTKGVLVVGHHLVHTKDGKTSPGESAGIEVGDIITKINDEEIEKMEEVSPLVKKAGADGTPLKLTVLRNNDQFSTELLPAKEEKSGQYRLGLYIRDSAAGIGTMTFYHPETKKYGALGHVISDMDTKQPIVVHEGKILRSTVTSIEKGSDGNPGEKLARFENESEVIGNITKNSPFGIFGVLKQSIENNVLDKPLPIALSHQVKEGPAKILTVVKGNKVKEYDVEIVNSIPQKFPATKGIVLRITDEELLRETGGIVQGMSGSPIIQDGKIIGAVTHVFVNDPTSGYGVHIEWMLNEAGIDIYENKDGKQQKAS